MAPKVGKPTKCRLAVWFWNGGRPDKIHAARKGNLRLSWTRLLAATAFVVARDHRNTGKIRIAKGTIAGTIGDGAFLAASSVGGSAKKCR